MSGEVISFKSDSDVILFWESEGGGLAAPTSSRQSALGGNNDQIDEPTYISKLHNDAGVLEIQIGMQEFECIGASPPHDHPHVYLNLGLSDVMLCPYCATVFRYAPMLAPNSVIPVNSIFR